MYSTSILLEGGGIDDSITDPESKRRVSLLSRKFLLVGGRPLITSKEQTQTKRRLVLNLLFLIDFQFVGSVVSARIPTAEPLSVSNGGTTLHSTDDRAPPTTEQIPYAPKRSTAVPLPTPP